MCCRPSSCGSFAPAGDLIVAATRASQVSKSSDLPDGLGLPLDMDRLLQYVDSGVTNVLY